MTNITSHVVFFYFIVLILGIKHAESLRQIILSKTFGNIVNFSARMLLKVFPRRKLENTTSGPLSAIALIERTPWGSWPWSSQTADDIDTVAILWRAVWFTYDVIKPLIKQYTVESSFLFPLVHKS